MRKRIVKHGGSFVLTIERALMEILEITEDTDLKVTTDGKRLVITPMREKERRNTAGVEL